MYLRCGASSFGLDDLFIQHIAQRIPSSGSLCKVADWMMRCFSGRSSSPRGLLYGGAYSTPVRSDSMLLLKQDQHQVKSVDQILAYHFSVRPTTMCAWIKQIGLISGSPKLLKSMDCGTG